MEKFGRFLRATFSRRYWPLKLLLLLAFGVGLYIIFPYVDDLQPNRWAGNNTFFRWRNGDAAEQAELIVQRGEACFDAPFILPTEGFIGLLYEDPRGPYSTSAPHQGIDIFSETEPGLTPVYAAYDGYITREGDWTSTLIQRVPDDPLQPGRQIWLYYTHMADSDGNDFIEEAFPRGVSELFVEQGTLLGYMGDFNGNSPRSIWTHLHFSIVKDNGRGEYLNELDFDNTVDPSPYFNMSLSYRCVPYGMGCSENPVCEG